MLKQILLFLIIIFSIILFFYYSNKKETKITIKNTKKSNIIPKVIYQTWHNKDLPPKMKETMDLIKLQNPDFNHYLYDENECRNFIKDNFNQEILNTYDKLKPISYKTDLWRFCVLYKNGGIYLDIKLRPVNNFKFIDVIDKEYFVLERPLYQPIPLENELQLINDDIYYDYIQAINTNFWKNKEVGVYTSLIITKPENQILLRCINTIVENVKNEEYGYNNLYVTGPGLLGEQYFNGDFCKEKIKEFDFFHSMKGGCILNKNTGPVLEDYKEYREDQKKYPDKIHYTELWDKRDIYNK